MNDIGPNYILSMILKAADELIANEKYLCELDAQVGDGDHGLTISRGFLAAKSELSNKNDLSINEILSLTGEILSDTMGGAIGPIFGSFFIAMSETFENLENLNTAKLKAMFTAGLEEIMLIGGAIPGDRTLIDSIKPAIDAMDEALPVDKSLKQAAIGAEEGAKLTANMVAKRGRARFLQEKSLGYQDAGATSFYILFKAFSDSF